MHPHPGRCTSPTRVAASPAGDTASPAGDTVASPKSWTCDTAVEMRDIIIDLYS